MSAQMYGADADELERIAAEIRGAADDLDAEGGALTAVLNRVSWLGDIASSFLGDWLGISLPKIGLSTEFLREAAANLEQQASEQRHASITSGAGGFRVKLTAQQKKMLNDLDGDARNQVGRTPAEQAAWWNSLTDEERRLLLSERPGLVMALSGLPPDALDQARQRYRSDVAAKVVVSTDTYELGAKVGVYKILNVGADLSAQKSVYADGSVDVTLTGAALGGAGVPGIGGSAGVLGTKTYRFDTQAEADRFLAGLAGSVVGGILPGLIGASGVTIYLAPFDRTNLYSAGGGLTVDNSVSLGPMSGSVDRSAVLTGNRDLEATITVALGAEGTIATTPDLLKFALKQVVPGGIVEPGLAVMVGDQHSGSWSGTASFTTGFSGTKQLTLTYTTMSGTSSGLHGLFTATDTHSTGQTTSIQFDLNDPLLAPHAAEIVAAVQRGDGDAVAQQISTVGMPADLLDRATITNTTFEARSLDAALDVFVASGSGGMSSTRTTSVAVKLPGESTATSLDY